MNNPLAKILSVASNEAVIEVAANSVCPRCAAGRGCGAGLIGATSKSMILTVRIDDDLAVVPGDQVHLSLAPRDLIRASLLAYGAPLAGLLLGSACAYLMLDPLTDALAAVYSAMGLLLGGITGRILSRRDDCAKRLSLSIVESGGTTV